MIGHNNHVRCLEVREMDKSEERSVFQMGEQNMISGSYDSSLKLWSLETGECVRTLVYVLFLSPFLIYSLVIVGFTIQL